MAIKAMSYEKRRVGSKLVKGRERISSPNLATRGSTVFKRERARFGKKKEKKEKTSRKKKEKKSIKKRQEEKQIFVGICLIQKKKQKKEIERG